MRKVHSARLSSRKLRFEQCEPRRVLSATLLVTEMLASNVDGLDDEDGDSSDWVEIHNPTSAQVDLDGWYLTDDADQLDRWRFPAITIDPGDYLVVFASGKDHADSTRQLHTNFQLSSEGEYLALVEPDGTSIAHDYTELIDPNGTPGFQIDAGLRIRGGFSRSPSNPKHAFRLFFRGTYDGALNFPLFEDEGASEFSNIDFRTAQNYSWSFQGSGENSFTPIAHKNICWQAAH